MQSLGPQDPQWIGDYRIVGRLGTGGMGHVYLARSEGGRTVAVKLVKPELANEPEFRQRFRQEVEAAQRVGGRWTASVLDANTDAAVPWVATSYVAGPSLSDIVDRHGPLPEDSVRTLAYGMACALLDIHGAGLIHRDLKPSNILVTIDGPRVIDFGIARALDAAAGDGTVTKTGMAVGSPAFMSPEQITGSELTPASDIFCLGSVLAYAGTGTLPFGTPTSSGVHAVMFRIAQNDPDLSGLPEEGGLRELIAGCLAKDPADRPAPEDLAAAIGPVNTGAAAPWLPAPIIAELGQHAVRLLDFDTPPGGAPQGPKRTSAQAGGAPGAQPAPANRTLIGVRQLEPEEEYAYEPAPPPAPGARGRRGRALGIAAVAALVLIGAGAAGAAMLGDSSGGGDGDKQTEGSDVPKEYLGTWVGDVLRDGEQNGSYRRFVISPGKKGEVVANSITMGKTAECKSDGKLVAANGELALDTKVVGSAPEGSCTALGRHTLKPGADGTLEWSAAGRSATLHKVEEGQEKLPDAMLGDWQQPFGGGLQYMNISEKPIGGRAITLTSDIAGNHCEAKADLIAAGDKVLIGPTVVTDAEVATACKPGPPSMLRMEGDKLIREWLNGVTAPRTYTRS
ncbi:serine/threonine protein kinase [Streptomyces sp. A7024]|uniref:Serine/threonine protein kinase n=1 Tax=Streptomyces coryli TaxID=1128680 RepID=A0A6G4U226_9ACTN|nr:serine/threonine-protein kinase [Streptomyces coryli]NGN66052.1 serine/threonine protein kinase [Streptomyces coryli]